MSGTYKTALRRELVQAAAREQARRRPRIVLPRPATVLAVAAACAALVVAAVLLRAIDQRDTAGRTPAVGERVRPLFGGTLESGFRYQTRALRPPVSFVPGDDSWLAREAGAADLLVLDREGARDAAGAARPPRQFLFIATVRRVFDPATGRDAPAPADLSAWVARHPDLRVDGRSVATVDGRRATVIDTTVAFKRPVRHDRDCERRFVSPFQPLQGAIVPCTALAPGLETPRGMGMRWIFVTVDGRQRVILIDGFPRSAYQRGLRPALALVGSLRFGR